MAPLRLKLLGGFEIRRPDGQGIVFNRKKAEALLTYLVLQPGQIYPRDELASLLWGDVDSNKARHSLRQVLVSLRQGLAVAGLPVLVDDRDGVTVVPSAVDVDVLAFERLAAASPHALGQALDLYRGELLPGMGRDGTSFDTWLLARREQLREEAIQAFTRLLEHQRSHGAADEAITTAVRLLAIDRTQETVHRTLMHLYADVGRRGAALRQYQACFAALDQELGAAPEDETRRLYQQLLSAHAVRPPKRPATLFGRAAYARPAASGMPIWGRDDELSQLRALCGELASGAGASLVMLGNAGVGKSRLVEALVEEAESAGMLVLLGRAWETERVLPFGPWVHAFRSAGILSELAAALDMPSRRELARLFPDLGTPPVDASGEDHLRLFEAVAKALRHLLLRGPLVVILEDLHWTDEMSARLLAFLARELAGSAVLLVTSARAGEMHGAPFVERALADIARQPRARTMALGPLSRNDTHTLVSMLVRARTGEHALRSLGEKAWRISKGNPLMVVETVYAERDTGNDSEAAGPQSADVLARRLNRLTGIAAQLAATAAVIGREFELALLAQAAGLRPAEATEGVAELVERGLLHAVGERLDFAHDRLRDAAYARLAGLHRGMLHGAVARALEKIHADDLAPHYPALGRHCFQSERWERAFHYLYAAGLDAAGRSAHRQAVADFEQALAAAEKLPSNPDRLRTAIQVSLSLRGSLTLLGDLKGTLQCLRAAEPHARLLGDPALQAWISIFIGNCLTAIGRHDEAVDIGGKVFSAAKGGAVAGLEPCWSGNVVGTSRFLMGDFREAQAWLRTAAGAQDIDHRRSGVIGHPTVVSHVYLAISLAETGDFKEALVHAARAIALSERLESSWDAVRACLAAGIVQLRCGEPAIAVPILRRGVELARQRELPMGAMILVPALCAGLVREGQVAAAREMLAPLAAAPLIPYYLNFAGEAYLLSGHPEEAEGIAARSLEQSLQRKEIGARAWALWLQGRIAADRAQHDRPAALERYREALALAEERQMRPLAAHCHFEIGGLQAARRQFGEARDALLRAEKIYRNMGTRRWLDRSQAALAAIDAGPAGVGAGH
jgi:DNA-binding SARP family transcriptional activator/tetratricopeptide (TPR) repeat protein